MGGTVLLWYAGIMMYFVPYRNSYGKDKLGIVFVFFWGGGDHDMLR